MEVCSFFRKRIFDFKKISEVGCYIETNLKVNWLLFMISNRQIFVKTATNEAFAYHGNICIDIGGPCSRCKKELCTNQPKLQNEQLSLFPHCTPNTMTTTEEDRWVSSCLVRD